MSDKDRTILRILQLLNRAIDELGQLAKELKDELTNQNPAYKVDIKGKDAGQKR